MSSIWPYPSNTSITQPAKEGAFFPDKSGDALGNLRVLTMQIPNEEIMAFTGIYWHLLLVIGSMHGCPVHYGATMQQECIAVSATGFSRKNVEVIAPL